MTTLSTSRGRGALAVSTVFTCLATALVLIRIYTRTVMVKQMGADDYAILVALAFSWAFFGLFVGEVYHGMGEHFKLIPADIYKTQMICFWASVPIYQTSLLVTKMSILFQYRRVFSTPRMRLACNLLIAFLAVYGTWTVLSAWANCVPLAKFWDPSVPGFCFDKKALWFSNSAIHILTDLLILIYPMPVLKSLQLPRKQKFALMGVFALGGFVMITSILRLKSLLVISNSSDPTYDNVGAAEWSAIECNHKSYALPTPPHIFSTRSNGSRSKTTRPSRTGRSVLTGTHTHVQASVIGGRDTKHDDYDLDDLTPPSSAPSYNKELDTKEAFAGIKVTTLVSQESTSHPAKSSTTDDAASTKELVPKQSFC
ncbi:hypothetical protein N7509_010200 [Penicillium cosmopolitanum]|uniref:Rhodopsin domain-containing protein n=1 Tax=Penicillium cosmopolitanum TaxID=1131564 RepID=A0A9W9VR65_9EURO|nr:uncharacterized protein N7509_010200 [Penicillium cosmopolitanum]KAJ5387659.1 hypothetical protein N7509_010200 [Penicillium cosmopolitanum]